MTFSVIQEVPPLPLKIPLFCHSTYSWVPLHKDLIGVEGFIPPSSLMVALVMCIHHAIKGEYGCESGMNPVRVLCGAKIPYRART